MLIPTKFLLTQKSVYEFSVAVNNLAVSTSVTVAALANPNDASTANIMNRYSFFIKILFMLV